MQGSCLEAANLTVELYQDDPELFDTLADLNLCAAVCYIQMCQYAQARESLELILRIERGQTEALLILGWSLTMNLITRHNK